MIGFLILIAAVVIGIFIYVLTIQKIDVFGVVKAQGISTGTIGRSVVVQTIILILIGVIENNPIAIIIPSHRVMIPSEQSGNHLATNHLG